MKNATFDSASSTWPRLVAPMKVVPVEEEPDTFGLQRLIVPNDVVGELNNPPLVHGVVRVDIGPEAEEVRHARHSSGQRPPRSDERPMQGDSRSVKGCRPPCLGGRS